MKRYEHPAMDLISVAAADCLCTSLTFGDIGKDGENVVDGGILNL